MAPFTYLGFKEWSREELEEGWTVSSVGSGAGLRKKSKPPEPELSPAELKERLVQALRALKSEAQTSSEAPEED